MNEERILEQAERTQRRVGFRRRRVLRALGLPYVHLHTCSTWTLMGRGARRQSSGV